MFFGGKVRKPAFRRPWATREYTGRNKRAAGKRPVRVICVSFRRLQLMTESSGGLNERVVPDWVQVSLQSLNKL